MPSLVVPCDDTAAALLCVLLHIINTSTFLWVIQYVDVVDVDGRGMMLPLA
jgi:hypothetical protein